MNYLFFSLVIGVSCTKKRKLKKKTLVMGLHEKTSRGTTIYFAHGGVTLANRIKELRMFAEISAIFSMIIICFYFRFSCRKEADIGVTIERLLVYTNADNAILYLNNNNKKDFLHTTIVFCLFHSYFNRRRDRTMC